MGKSVGLPLTGDRRSKPLRAENGVCSGLAPRVQQKTTNYVFSVTSIRIETRQGSKTDFFPHPSTRVIRIYSLDPLSGIGYLAGVSWGQAQVVSPNHAAI